MTGKHSNLATCVLWGLFSYPGWYFQTEIKKWCKIFVSPWITTLQLSTTFRKALYMFIIDAIIEHTFGKTFNWWYGFSVCYSEEIRRLYTHIRIADIHLITPDELWCVIRGHNPYIAFIWHPCTSVCHSSNYRHKLLTALIWQTPATTD